MRLHWRTAAAPDALGFQVWRQRGSGPLRKATAVLLPAKAGTRAASYSFLDSQARSAGLYRYRLRVVALSGARYWAGVTTARVLG